MEFEWDENKAKSNFEQHRITFDEASTIFGDYFAITVFNLDHSDYEVRFITIGSTENGRLLIVSYQDSEDTIRIISARKATISEKRVYENG